ncbi:MAG: tape measure protein [Faecalibacterium sp.]
MGKSYDASIVIGAQIDAEQAEKGISDLSGNLSGTMRSGADQVAQSAASITQDLSGLIDEAKKTSAALSDIGTVPIAPQIDTSGIGKGKEDLQAAAKSADDAGDSLQDMGQEAAKASQEVENLGDAVSESAQKTEKSSKRLSLGLNAISVAAGNLLSKLAQAAVKAVGEIVSTGVAFNAQMETYQMGLTNLLGDAEAASAVLESIKADAAATPFDTAGLVQANRLLISTGQSAEDARQTVLALGDAVAASGGGSDELSRMAQNLQQIANVGKATAMDIRQFAMAGIDVYGVLADYTGLTTAEVQELDISYDLLTAALKAAADEGGRFYGAMDTQSQTLNGRISTLSDNAKQLTGALTEALFEGEKALVESAIVWVQTLADTLETEGPGAMLEAGAEIVLDFLEGVVDALPGVVNAGVQTATDFIAGLINRLPEIAEAGGRIVGKLCSGVLSVAASLASAAVQLVETFAVQFLTFEWVDVGIGIVKGIIEGFLETLPKLAQTVKDAVSNIIQSAQNAFSAASDNIIVPVTKSSGGSKKDETYLEQERQRRKQLHDERVRQAQTQTGGFDLEAYLAGLGSTQPSDGGSKTVKTLSQQLKELSRALDSSQSAYKTLTDAAQEYNESGTLSIDTWQELCQLGPEYLELLVEQEGQLSLNEEGYQKLIDAQKDELLALAKTNGASKETIALLERLGDAATDAAKKTQTTFKELSRNLSKLTDGSILSVISDLADALCSRDWTAAAQAVAEGLFDTLTYEQQTAIGGWGLATVQQLNDAFAAEGWAGLINAGSAIVQGLAEGITDGSSIFVQAAQGLFSTFSGLAGQCFPAVKNAALALLNAFSALVPGIDLASVATGIFNAVLDANPIVLVISLIGMLVSALYGFARVNGEVGDKVRGIWDGIVDCVKGALKIVLSIVEAVFESVFTAWNLFVGVAGKYLGLKEIHFDFTSWLDNDEALKENTEALKENTKKYLESPAYKTTGADMQAADYAALLAAARAEAERQNQHAAINYDAGSGTTAARLNASWQGRTTAVLQVDGREVARATAEYMDEELAF